MFDSSAPAAYPQCYPCHDALRPNHRCPGPASRDSVETVSTEIEPGGVGWSRENAFHSHLTVRPAKAHATQQMLETDPRNKTLMKWLTVALLALCALP